MDDKAAITRDALRDRLASFAPAAEGSSLYLLRAIDQTVDSLQEIEHFASAIDVEARRFAGEIRADAVVAGRFLDPDDKAIDQLEAGYRAIEVRLPGLVLRKSTIVGQKQLDCDRSDMLQIAFDRCIDALAAYVEAIKDLRAAVIGRDLAAELPPSESFGSASALIDSLHATFP